MFQSKGASPVFGQASPQARPQYLKQLDLHGRGQYWSRKILSISGLSHSALRNHALRKRGPVFCLQLLKQGHFLRPQWRVSDKPEPQQEVTSPHFDVEGTRNVAKM
jgi:hypothetical protein